MNYLLSGVALGVSLAVGCSDGMEIPPVEVGGSGGARLMNGQPKTPGEAFDKSYAQLARAHYNVRRNLDPRTPNQFGAEEAMRQILDLLKTMRGCVPPKGQAQFLPYLTRYGDWLKDLEKGTWGGSFLGDLDRSERDLKTQFEPSGMDLLARFPDAGRAASGPEPLPRPPGAKPADTGLTPDKVEVPTGSSAPPAEKAQPSPPPPAPDRSVPAAGSSAVSPRLLYRAWASAHDDLISAYRERKPCKPKYDDLLESLRLLKAQLPADQASKLQIYIEYYGGVDEKTKSFTSLPEKTTQKDIIDELDVAARVIRKEFNPDK